MLIQSSGPYNIITGKGLCGFRIKPLFDTVFIFSTKLRFFYLFILFFYKYYDCNRTHEWRACQCSLVTSRLLVHKILFHSDLRRAALWYGPVHSHLPPTAPPLTCRVPSECLGTRSLETTSRDHRGKIEMFLSSTGACTTAKSPIANIHSQITAQLYSASFICHFWQQCHSDSEFDAL